MNNNRHEISCSTSKIAVNKTMQISAFFTLTAVLLFTLLMTTYPPVHDFFHGLRHALMIIPCH